MITPTLKVRMPDKFHPHTIEVVVPWGAQFSNWIIRCTENKSGARRGCSPTWYGFKPGDVPLARTLASAPMLRDALAEMVKAVERYELVTAFGDDYVAAKAILEQLEGGPDANRPV
ncbi:MAG TPA: hypothetical protein VF151_10975 [Gemmatimonadales bacterium]